MITLALDGTRRLPAFRISVGRKMTRGLPLGERTSSSINLEIVFHTSLHSTEIFRPKFR